MLRLCKSFNVKREFHFERKRVRSYLREARDQHIMLPTQMNRIPRITLLRFLFIKKQTIFILLVYLSYTYAANKKRKQTVRRGTERGRENSDIKTTCMAKAIKITRDTYPRVLHTQHGMRAYVIYPYNLCCQ